MATVSAAVAVQQSLLFWSSGASATGATVAASNIKPTLSSTTDVMLGLSQTLQALVEPVSLIASDSRVVAGAKKLGPGLAWAALGKDIIDIGTILNNSDLTVEQQNKALAGEVISGFANITAIAGSYLVGAAVVAVGAGAVTVGSAAILTLGAVAVVAGMGLAVYGAALEKIPGTVY